MGLTYLRFNLLVGFWRCGMNPKMTYLLKITVAEKEKKQVKRL